MLPVAGLLVFVLAVLLAKAKVLLLIKFSDFFGLYDESDGHRKLHATGISRLGGLGIYSAFLVTLLICVDLASGDVAEILCSSAIICLVGLKDDLSGGLQPSEKLIFQIGIGLFCIRGGIAITEENPFSEQICLLVIIVFSVNAFNLIDGIDGLAAALGVLVNVIFGCMFFELQEMNWCLICFAFAGSTAGFLRYNLFKARIFMGDSGSMLTGLVSIIAAIKLIWFCQAGMGHESVYCQSAAPVICLAVLIVPVFDALRVFSARVIKLKSPFVGDRSHVHHQLQSLGLSDPLILLVLLIFNIVLIVISFILQESGNLFVAMLLFLLCGIAQCWLNRLKSKRG